MRLAALLSLAAAGLLAAWLALRTDRRDPPLVVYAAVSLRPALEPVAAEFERGTGQRVELRFGASEQMLTQAELNAGTNPGDVLIPADDSYLQGPRAEALAASVRPVAAMRGVALVSATFAGSTWADLTAPGVRHALANPDLAAIGRRTRQHLRETGRWGELEARIVAQTENVSESANAVRLGTVDVAVVWNVVARQHPTLRALELPELAGVRATVAVAVLKQSPRPELAERFAAFVAGRASAEFAAAGFEPL